MWVLRCCLLLLISPLMAQTTYVVEGEVQNEEGKAIAEAFILLMPNNAIAYTNSKGAFVFKDLTAQTYQISINAEGYQTQDLTLHLQKDVLDLTISLKKLSAGGGRWLPPQSCY